MAAMNVGRRNEKPKTWFRSERVFLNGGSWFFRTREGVEIGPYETQSEANVEANMLRELLRDRGQDGKGIAVIREFVRDSYAMGRPLTPKFD